MFFDLNHLRAFGAAPCLLTGSESTISYSELADWAEMLGQSLSASRGLVAIEMAAEPEPIAAYIGALAAGHAVMPLPDGDEDTARSLIARFKPDFSYMRAGGLWHLQRHQGAASTLHPDLAVLLQTSGSTGQGRGVRLSYTAVQSNAASIVEYLNLNANERAALVLPLHYSYGLSVLNSHLLAGGSLWLSQGSIMDSDFKPALAASKSTSMACVPYHFRLLEGAGLIGDLPETIKTLTVAGGAMEPDKVRAWAGHMARRGGQLVVMYGQTEATARISYLPADLAHDIPNSIGRAIPGGEIFIDGDDGTPGAEGELIYRGPNVMMGYAMDATELANEPDVQELRTGDLARRDADGNFYITGRLSRMSKIAGLRIGHDALERALHERGHTVAVWGDDRIIHVASLTDSGDLADQVAQLAGIGRQHVQTTTLDELPRLPNGKIDYPTLKAQGEGRTHDTDLLTAFRVTFAPKPVSPDDSFTSLGGDSLRHVELSLVLDDALGSAPEGWERTPIKDLQVVKPKKTNSVPTELLVRALAILAVVTAHQTNIPVYGGAAAMVVLIGMSIADFRWGALTSGDWGQYFRPMLGVLVPYYMILTGYALVWGEVPWYSVFLVGNFALTIPETHLMLPYLYWFVEAYVQITLLIALPFLVPRFRKWLAQSGKLAVGLYLLGFSIALRMVVPELWPMNGRAQFTVPWVLYLFALGWCIVAATTVRQRLILLAMACLIMPGAAYFGGNWYGGWIKYLGLLAVIGVLLFLPRLPMPHLVKRPITRIAQAAFAIYLLHRFVPELIMPALGWEGHSALIDSVAIVGGVVIGLVVAAIQRRLMRTRFDLQTIGPKARSLLQG